MSTIGGAKRESTGELDFSKKVGLFQFKVIAINPTESEFQNKLGIELKEDSKAAEYIGESRDGNTTLRVDVWVEQIVKAEETPFRNKITFFLEDKKRENKDGTKYQFINSVGVCSWAEDENDLAEWFTKGRDVRQAYAGEEDLYNFLRSWLNQLDYRHVETTLLQEWKKLMKGNVKDLRDQVNGEWCGELIAMATVITRERDGEIKEYQGIYNKAFLPTYVLKNFRLVDYSDEIVLEQLSKKKTKDLKIYEKFVLNVTGEYGCKDYYTFKDLADYNPDENVVSGNQSLIEDDPEY